MSEPGAALMRLEGVTKAYGETVVTEVLHGIDLELCAGDFAALVGPSGSGKSTLLNLIGLLDRPTAGRVTWQGRDTQSLADDDLTRLRGLSLGFVFQFHHLLPAFTALENVMLPMIAARGRLTHEMAECAGVLLERVGLGGFRDRLASRLSGGQQQRVAIARALALSPALVLADEPTGNLDTETGEEVFALLREFNRASGTALLVVTHDQGLAERCDRIIELVDGRIVSDARPGNRGRVT